MKFSFLKFYFLVAILISCINLFGQSVGCENLPFSSDAMFNYGINTSNLNPTTSRVVKIYFVIYEDGSGNGGVSDARLNVLYSDLNTRYTGTGISFFYRQCETERVKNDELYASRNDCIYYNSIYSKPNGITIHVKTNNTIASRASSIPGKEIILNDSDNTEIDPILAHEMGHCFGLFHTFHGTCSGNGERCDGTQVASSSISGDYVDDTPEDPRSVLDNCVHVAPICKTGAFNPLVNNIMTWNVNCRNSFTEGQKIRAINLMLPEIIHNGPSNPCECGNVLTVTSNTLINTDGNYEEIKILNGQLTILNSDILIAKSITVSNGASLVIDGSTISNCFGVNKWEGIIANGPIWFAVPNLSVELKNGSSIQNAMIGINTYKSINLGIATLPNSGAKIKSTDSNFTNCDTGILFGPYGFSAPAPWGTLLDNSYIYNTNFNSCNIGVDLDRNFGIKIESCSFNSETGVRSTNATFNLTDCTFDCDLGILIDAVYPALLPPTLKHNIFEGFNGIEINTQVNSIPLEASNNSFLTTNTGIYMNGELGFVVRNNDFIKNYAGISIYDSGIATNRIINNYYNLNDEANQIYGQNNFVFQTNCFESTKKFDILLNQGSSIFPRQGDQTKGASNCFNSDIGKRMKSINATPVEYFCKEGINNNTCNYPGNSNGITVKSSLADEVDLECGSELYSAYGDIFDDCVIPTNALEKKKMEENLKARINQIENDPTLTPSVKFWFLARLQGCLEKLIGKVGIDFLFENSDGKENAKLYFINQQEFRHKIKAYAIMLHYNQLENANNFINNLAVTKEEEIDFVYAQNLYLQYLTNINEFTISSVAREKLRTNGLKSNKYSGFSRTIYRVLTGERLSFTSNTLVEERSKIDKKSIDGKIVSYPNPVVNGSYQVYIPCDESDINYRIVINDVFGNSVIVQQNSCGHHNIDVNGLKSGLYIMNITTPEKTIYTSKFIKY